MSPSWDASKRLFASSNDALASALRIAFASLGAGVAAFTIAGSGGILPRIAASIVPALGVMAIVLVVALALELAKRLQRSRVAFVCGAALAFALALPRHDEGVIAFFPRLGGSGLFLAILICLAILLLSLVVRDWAAAAIVVAAVGALRAAGVSPADALYAALQPLGKLGDSYAALAIVVVVETCLWLIGIHGPAVLAAIVTPVYLTLQGENAHAFALGKPLPHVVTTSTFLFIFPGGAGATLPLVLLMLRSRVRSLRRLAAAAVAPSFAGINEPLMFGLPMIFQPAFAIPFVAVPLILCTTTYVAIASGLVARPAYYIPASIPPVLNGFLATADWRACVLSLANVAIAGVLYFPFLRRYERERPAA
jgi:PTS system cellobiose-specific IIC component